MAKRRIVNWFIAGLVAFVPALILIPSSALAWAAHLTALGSANSQGWLPDDYSRRMLVAIIAGAAFAAIGLVAEIAGWAGAVANSNQLADKKWFRAVLWSGIAAIVTAALFAVASFVNGVAAAVTGGLFALAAVCASYASLAYLVAAPDAVGPARSEGGVVFARTVVMPKSAIAAWFGWGWVPIAIGGSFALLASALGDPGRVLYGHTWTVLTLVFTALAIAAVGVIAEFVSGWAMLFNAHRLADKTWFNVLLWSDIVATVLMALFGLGAVILLGVGIAYLRGAADGSSVQASIAPTGKFAPVG